MDNYHTKILPAPSSLPASFMASTLQLFRIAASKVKIAMWNTNFLCGKEDTLCLSIRNKYRAWSSLVKTNLEGQCCWKLSIFDHWIRNKDEVYKFLSFNWLIQLNWLVAIWSSSTEKGFSKRWSSSREKYSAQSHFWHFRSFLG